MHKHLWRQVILPLEDEFRKPSFQTIQTAIVILTSRPAINVAQNHIAMGRVSLPSLLAMASAKLTRSCDDAGRHGGAAARTAFGPVGLAGVVE